MRTCIQTILRALKLPDCEISLVFCGPDEMAHHNRAYLKRRGPTDILSFPAARSPIILGQPIGLGDLLICPDLVARYGRKHKKTFREEMGLILIHGILHLMGYDHDTPRNKRIMRAKESEILDSAAKKLKGLRWPSR